MLHVVSCTIQIYYFTPTKSDGKRERGNFWYDRGEYNLAIQLYRRSLEYLDDVDKYVGESSKMEKVIIIYKLQLSSSNIFFLNKYNLLN